MYSCLYWRWPERKTDFVGMVVTLHNSWLKSYVKRNKLILRHKADFSLFCFCSLLLHGFWELRFTIAWNSTYICSWCRGIRHPRELMDNYHVLHQNHYFSKNSIPELRDDSLEIIAELIILFLIVLGQRLRSPGVSSVRIFLPHCATLARNRWIFLWKQKTPPTYDD